MSSRVINKGEKYKILVTKELPGTKWLEIFTAANCEVTIFDSTQATSKDSLLSILGDNNFNGALGQLSENWDQEVLQLFHQKGGRIYSNYAVGYNNIDLTTASKLKIPVCNTPGVLTDTTAELAVALTFAAARRVVEGDNFMREGHFKGWLPKLLRGKLLKGKTLGVIGAGRVGGAYAKKMVMGMEMNLLYYSPSPKPELEQYINNFYGFLNKKDQLSCKRSNLLSDLLQKSDVIALFPRFTNDTLHLISSNELKMMKDDAVLINLSRGPVVDEKALVTHLQNNSKFRVGLDVYEQEPKMESGLSKLPNVVLAPHTGSSSYETRENMATLAALNIVGHLKGFKPWNKEEMQPFLTENPPQFIPSIIN
jgi:glycerate dehydrogenase